MAGIPFFSRRGSAQAELMGRPGPVERPARGARRCPRAVQAAALLLVLSAGAFFWGNTAAKAATAVGSPGGAVPPSRMGWAWSDCSGGKDLADSGGVHGLFVASPNAIQDATTESAIMSYLPPDPTICGANLEIPWSQIDLGPGHTPQYNWSYLDNAAAPWEAAGKIVNLIVWGTDEKAKEQLNGPLGTPQPSTPAYVLASTPTVSCPNDGNVPVYWNSGYAKPWQAFEAALVAHVNSDPHVGYIRFGLGTGGEDFPVDGFDAGACWTSWQAAGLTATQWQQWSIDQIDYEASLGSAHPINIGINSFPGAPTLPDNVAAEAVKYGLGFGMQGMTDTQMGYDTPAAYSQCYAGWCSLFAAHVGQVPLEVQPLNASAPAGDTTPAWLLPPLLDSSINQARAQALELYPQEWLVADDPSWPTYSGYHASYAAALNQAAAEVGGQKGFVPPPVVVPPPIKPTCKGSACM